MKRMFARFLSLLFLMTAMGCGASRPAQETVPTTEAVTVSVTEPAETLPAETAPPPTLPVPPLEPVLVLSGEEKEMLLKIGMAELGQGGCTECIALVMCTIQNRVEADRFGSSIRSVLFAPEQFTPVLDGTYYQAEPNENCYDALEMVVYGWDESQGALYYEFCEGESWHSKNLQLLFQHCNTRFYI